MTWRRWVSSLFTMLAVFPFLSGCGGGGNASSPSEIAYVLSEDSNSNGSVVEYALNPSNGTFYPGSGQTAISTGGSSPFLFLLSPHNHYAFVLNNNNPSGTSSNGSIASFSVSGQGLSSAPISKQPTGPNPVHMAVDPGGNYLVVANHGNGNSSSGSGYVQVFPISSGVLSSSSPTPSSSTPPCANPFRVVFGPGSTGAPSDPVYVACSSPELLTASSSHSPTIEIYSCTIGSLIAGNCSGSISISSLPSSPNALLNFMLDPGGQYLVGPGTSYSASAYSGFLVVCPLSGGSCTSTSISSFITLPSGNIAFTGSGTSEKVFIGNYNASPSSLNGDFVSCTLSSPTTCQQYSINQNGPIYLTTNGNSLYIAATQTPISSTYSSSTNTGTGSGSTHPSTGYLFYCTFPLSSSSPCTSSLPTGGWPVGIAIDPTGNFMFVPTLSGAVNVFSGVSTGSLSPLGSNPLQMPNSLIPLSVTIH